MTVQLLTTHEAFERLHSLADGRGSVKVDRETLTKLLIDHTAMYNALRGTSVKVVAPIKHRERAVLRE